LHDAKEVNSTDHRMKLSEIIILDAFKSLWGGIARCSIDVFGVVWVIWRKVCCRVVVKVFSTIVVIFLVEGVGVRPFVELPESRD
jgi:hypothetical protein